MSVTNVYKYGGNNTACTEYNTDTPLVLKILKNLQIKLKKHKEDSFRTGKVKTDLVFELRQI
jgi:hypothetical protein